MSDVILCLSIPGAIVPDMVLDDSTAIGGGFTGKVYRMRNVKTEQYYAAKVLPNDPSSAWDVQMFSKAAERLAGKNVVPELYGVREILDGQWLVIVMQLLQPLPENNYRVSAREIRRCLQTFHEAGFGHGDVHMDNFMWDPETETVRIIDFGLAYDYEDPPTGPFRFLPNVLRGKKIGVNMQRMIRNVDRNSIESVRRADFMVDDQRMEAVIDFLSL